MRSSSFKNEEVCMDLSVIATIGFTTIAIIGIFVLVFTAGGPKKEE
jgi:hypothetical protein